MKISVIIPVYNSEKFLVRCLDSVINQTYQNLEILIINDGSTDNSLEIIKNYAQSDNRIRFFSQENKGQSAARNVGLENATGDYIGFVDSDDWISERMYEVLYDLLKKYNADMAQCELISDNAMMVENKQLIIHEVSAKTWMAELVLNTGKYGLMYKLFKREAIGNQKFQLNRIYEDSIFLYDVYPNINKVVFTNEILYFYGSNYESTTRKTFTEKRLDVLNALERSIQFLRLNNFENEILISVEKRVVTHCYSLYLQSIKYQPDGYLKMINKIKSVQKKYIIRCSSLKIWLQFLLPVSVFKFVYTILKS